jgi:Glyoxalase-like domain
MLDHLVYAAPDLEATVHDLAHKIGVTASEGGRHLGRGTRNYLLSLGNDAYLEIIGPDREQAVPPLGRHFGLDHLERPRLVGWAMKAPDIQRQVLAARAAGYDPGPVQAMTRATPDGSVLSWTLTLSLGADVPNLVPFLIDWGDSVHPSTTAPSGATLRDFHAESPYPEDVRARLDALGASLGVCFSSQPALVARIAGPAGEVTLT